MKSEQCDFPTVPGEVSTSNHAFTRALSLFSESQTIAIQASNFFKNHPESLLAEHPRISLDVFPLLFPKSPFRVPSRS